MRVTESGSTTDVSFVQPAKALKPMIVTELGITTDTSLVQASKA
jgi:hypothetical protein